MNDQFLDGKVALITGAGSGFGREIAISYASKGADLVINDINMEGLVETKDLVLKQYERDWLKTNFSSKLFNEAFEKLRRMSNSELARHIKPFRNVKLESLISMSIMHIKIFLFYKKYFKLYKTYELCDEVGW